MRSRNPTIGLSFALFKMEREAFADGMESGN
jgi:hypothetical protein